MLSIDCVTQYALDVTEGRIVAGPYVRAACERHMRDRDRSDIWFDRSDAERIIFDFFEGQVRLSDGQFEGKPMTLQPVQRFIVGSIFGWKRPPDDRPDAPRREWVRRFRRAYIEMGKGNGKSPLAGGIGLYGMLYDGEPGAQIFSAGADRNQSDILFQDAVKMAQSAPDITALVTFAGNNKIFNMSGLGPEQRGSYFRPLARTAGKQGSGYRPHMALVDEVHEHPDGAVLDLLERGFKFRRQPLLFMTTNSGTDRKSVCWREREHAVSVALGDTRDDSTFSFVCALDKGDDPLEDESCWIKANPLLDVTITRKYLRGVVDQANAMPGKRNGVLRLHFCVWTDAETAWITREQWESIEDPTLDIEDFEGEPCRAGLDLSSRRDLTAKALVFDDGWTEPDEEDRVRKKFAAFVHGYTPEVGLRQRAKEDRAAYDEWEKDGYLTATPGPVIRFPFVIADLEEDSQRYNLEAVAYDRYMIKRFEEDMLDMGVDLPLVEHPQGFPRRKDTDLWMPGSIELLEELILEGRLRVHVNPALRASVTGATFISSPAGLRRFAKEKASQRIDCLIALAMAVGASCTADDEGGPSIYEVIAKQRAERHSSGEDEEPRELRDEDEEEYDEFEEYY